MNIEKLDKLIVAYKEHFKKNIERELYKWQAVKCFQDNWDIEAEDFASMLFKSLEKTENLLDSGNNFPRGMINALSRFNSEEVREAFRVLFDEEKNLKNRIDEFKSRIEKIHKKYQEQDLKAKNHYQKDNAISVYLFLCYPEKYYIYKYGLTQAIFDKLGVDVNLFAKGADAIVKCYEVYDEIAKKLQSDEDYRSLLDSFLNDNCYRDEALRVAVVDFAFYVGVYMKKYWLVGHSFGSTDTQLDRFLKGEIWEGRFDEKRDKNQISLASKISVGDIIILKSTFTKGKNHDISCLRVKAVGVVTNNVVKINKREYVECKCDVNYINIDEMDFDGYGSYRQTIHRVDSKHTELIDYVDNILEDKTMIVKNSEQKYSEYIKLLKGAHNLVLTGAPGTGKTYMAREIAKEMGANENFIKMVQFHPSYDYTDFVEGLRPIKEGDSLGFQRKDGVFKAFCKEAQSSLSLSDKAIKEIYNSILERVKKGDEIKVRQQSGKYKILSEITEGNLGWLRGEDAKADPDIVSIGMVLKVFHQYPTKEAFSKISPSDIRKQKVLGGDPTMIWTIVNYLWEEINKQKTYVFIIDEINRGEISKIFGELFYSIDPGYRGEKGKVDTQYQNLIPKEGDWDFDATNPDVFRNGFYVPENVYILATMNDIDRSVESMDFAMRRRFTWKEVTPTDTESMLDKLSCASSAKERMRWLNKEIAKVDGLGEAYMIGPAYFLKLEKYNNDFEQLWEMHLCPLLKEYLRGFRNAQKTLEKLKEVYDGKVKEEANTENTTTNEN